MNKIDDKVIVDRKVFVGILDMARRGLDSGFFGEVFYQDFAKGEQALAADLTGWAAVPVQPTEKMAFVGADCLPDSVCEWEACALDTYRAMLTASPLLPGGGE